MQTAAHDRRILRDLAAEVAEIAALPEQQTRADTWRDHNDLHPHRPMVLIFPEGSWSEIMADWKMRCEDDWARGLERHLRMRLYAWENLRDDNVVEPVLYCPVKTVSTGWGLAGKRIPAENVVKGAYHIDPVLVEETDIDKIRCPRVEVDWEDTHRRRDQLQDLLGDLLEVKEVVGSGGCHGWAPMDLLASWRGIDQLYLDLIERPEWVHRVMQKLLEGRLAEIEALEVQGALTLNNRSQYNGSGGVGYTRQLPPADADPARVRLRDLWGMATAQIFADVSPSMHNEFALKYEKQYLERFGLANYGCCEPLHRKLADIKCIRNLRRVSISPWADVRKSAEELDGDYVLSWKPNPAIIAAPTWDPDAVREGITRFCEDTRGCVTDIIMKDTHTCNQQPERLSAWVRIALEVAQDFPA